QEPSGVTGLKILVADDHHLVREGLKLMLHQFDADAVVLEAETLRDAVETYRANPDIDLVLLDLSMPGASGISALDTFETECPAARLVVVSATCDLNTVQTAIHKGALGFIPKLAGKRILHGALRFVLDGGIYVPPEAVCTTGADPEAVAVA